VAAGARFAGPPAEPLQKRAGKSERACVDWPFSVRAQRTCLHTSQCVLCEWLAQSCRPCPLAQTASSAVMEPAECSDCHNQCVRAIDHCEHVLNRIPSADQIEEAVAEGMVMMVQLQELHAKACIATQEREKQVHQRKEQYEAMQLARENKRCDLCPDSAVVSYNQWGHVEMDMRVCLYTAPTLAPQHETRGPTL
jgi:hypothetical protein